MATGLALVRYVGSGSPVGEVFVVDAAGEFHQLTGLGSTSSLGASLPAWSPDGRHVAFGPPKVGAGPDRFLSVIEADGSGERPLAALGDEFGLPFGWSPDGATLLFFDIDAVDGPAMWLADVASGEVRHLGVGQLPRWLPDGHRISFKRGVEGRDTADERALTEVIYVMSLDRGEEAELARASDAFWSPDGSAVLLQRAAVDRDGHALWSGVAGSSPTWSPDG